MKIEKLICKVWVNVKFEVSWGLSPSNKKQIYPNERKPYTSESIQVLWQRRLFSPYLRHIDILWQNTDAHALHIVENIIYDNS